MHIYRSSLLRFNDDGQALYDEDGLLATAPGSDGRERVLAAGREMKESSAPRVMLLASAMCTIRRRSTRSKCMAMAGIVESA